MPHLFLVMAGGAIGAGLRFLVGRASISLFGPELPWGTLIVNLSGGLLMGALVGLLARLGDGGAVTRLFVGVGILGGFTTFSAFSLETAVMIERGQVGLAAGYILVSVMGSIAALFAGLMLTRAAA